MLDTGISNTEALLPYVPPLVQIVGSLQALTLGTGGFVNDNLGAAVDGLVGSSV